MINNLFLFALLLNLTLISCKEKDPTLPAVSETLMPEHPRILWGNEEEQPIKTAITVNGSWQKKVHDFISAECDKFMSLPPKERVLTGVRLLEVSREMKRRIIYLSYMYRITGDQKYKDRAVVEINAACNFSDWNPTHFLDVAEMSLGIGIGYDWLYKTLPDSTRTKIVLAIRNKGIDPSYNSSYNSVFLNSTSNWNLVCHSGIMTAAVATLEKESDCLKVISRATTYMPTALGAYGPDGTYPEGYGYWIYGTSFAVVGIATLQHLYGNKYDAQLLPTYFMKTPYYYENMIGSSGGCYSYGDTQLNTTVSPPMFWFAKKLNDPSLLWIEKNYLNATISNLDAFMPMLLIWASNYDTNAITEPTKKSFFGTGEAPIALMRTSWNNTDAISMAFKGGTMTTSHSHMDVGSFLFDAGSTRWAMDYGADDYTKLEANGNPWDMSQSSFRWTVFRYNNLAHNTLAFDGAKQIVSGKATITKSSDQNYNFMYAVADLSPVYNGQVVSAQRGVAIINGKYGLIRDEIVNLPNKTTTLRWNMLTKGVPTIQQSSQSILLTQGTQKLTLKVASPTTGVTMKTWTTVAPNSYEASNVGTYLVGFEITLPAGSTNNVSVQLIPAGNESFVGSDDKLLNLWGQ
ncbi:MAG: heparinase II/III family protein [Paludibacter sp.]